MGYMEIISRCKRKRYMSEGDNDDPRILPQSSYLAASHPARRRRSVSGPTIAVLQPLDDRYIVTKGRVHVKKNLTGIFFILPLFGFVSIISKLSK